MTQQRSQAHCLDWRAVQSALRQHHAMILEQQHVITDSACSQPHRRPCQEGALQGVVASQVAARLAEGGPLEGGLAAAAAPAALLMCWAVLACLQKSMAENEKPIAPNSPRLQGTAPGPIPLYLLHSGGTKQQSQKLGDIASLQSCQLLVTQLTHSLSRHVEG